MAPPTSGNEFFAALWGDSTGFAELRLIGPGKKPVQRFFPYPEMLANFVSSAQTASGTLNVYFGVCLRKREAGKAEDVEQASCLWVDIDFKTTPQDKALEALKTLPTRPSLGVASGAGFHVYWLLKEPVTGQELEKIPQINRALAKTIGGDHTQDLARILRVPDTLNMKYQPPAPCRIVVFRPQIRYSLDDFSFLSLEPATTPRKLSTTVSPPPETTEPIDLEDLPVSESVKKVIREGKNAYVEFRRLTDHPDKFAEREREGRLSRSEADAWVIISLLRSEVSDEDIWAIYRDPRYGIGEKTREVGDRYLLHTLGVCKKLVSNQRGWTPEYAATKAVGAIEREFEDRRLKILRIKKHKQQPEPYYEITVKIKENEFTLTCTLDELMTYLRFRRRFFADNGKFPPNQRQNTWEKMLSEAPNEIVEIAPQEATVSGQVRTAIEELVGTAVLDKNAEISINYLPLRTEQGMVYFRSSVLMKFLQAQKIAAEKREVLPQLISLGFKSIVKKVGKRTVRVWTLDKIENQAGYTQMLPPENGQHGQQGRLYEG